MIGHKWQLHQIQPDELYWSFRTSEPTWVDQSGRSSTFDPFPAYPHDSELVLETIRAVTEVFPPDWPGTVNLSQWEEVGRTNGWASERSAHDDESGKWVPVEGIIFLSGKRIPPHPAVTRYVVAHEYGHQVSCMLATRAGQQWTDAANDYAEMRGVEIILGSGGKWHEAAYELMADDFRVYVAGVETDYWPHPRLPRPEQMPKVRRWWDDRTEQQRGAA